MPRAVPKETRKETRKINPPRCKLFDFLLAQAVEPVDLLTGNSSGRTSRKLDHVAAPDCSFHQDRAINSGLVIVGLIDRP